MPSPSRRRDRDGPPPKSPATSSRLTSSRTCLPRSTIAQEEIFGPVLSVIRASNFDRGSGAGARRPLRPHRRPLLPQPGAHHAGGAGVPGGQPVHQPADHRSHGGPAAVRRLPHERRGLQGRRARTTCCSSWSPGWSPRTPSGEDSRRTRPPERRSAERLGPRAAGRKRYRRRHDAGSLRSPAARG